MSRHLPVMMSTSSSQCTAAVTVHSGQWSLIVRRRLADCYRATSAGGGGGALLD